MCHSMNVDTKIGAEFIEVPVICVMQTQSQMPITFSLNGLLPV